MDDIQNTNDDQETDRSEKPALPAEASELKTAYRQLRGKAEALQQAHQRLKDKLINAQESLSAILNSVADALLVTDSEGLIVELNSQGEELFEVKRQQAAGRHYRDVLCNPQLTEGIRLALQELPSGYSFEFGERRFSGDRVYQARAFCLCASSGNPRGLVVVFRDISRLRELERMKSEFLSAASHKLRAPLTSIVGFSEILLTRPNMTDKESRRCIQLLHKESALLSELVADVIDVAKIESEQGLILDLQRVRLKELLRTEAESFAAFQTTHDLDLILADDLPPVLCDPLRMRQLVRHLLSNAIKYSPGGGKVRVRAKADDRWVRVSISDQGIGMSPEQISQAFDKFYRADSLDTAVEGTGLGLSIVKAILESHNGTISIESEPNHGSTVEFTLPVDERPQGARPKEAA